MDSCALVPSGDTTWPGAPSEARTSTVRPPSSGRDSNHHSASPSEARPVREQALGGHVGQGEARVPGAERGERAHPSNRSAMAMRPTVAVPLV